MENWKRKEKACFKGLWKICKDRSYIGTHFRIEFSVISSEREKKV